MLQGSNIMQYNTKKYKTFQDVTRVQEKVGEALDTT